MRSGSKIPPTPTTPSPASARARGSRSCRRKASSIRCGLRRLAERLRPVADALDDEPPSLIERAAEICDGYIRIRRSAWRGGTEARRRALAVLLSAVSGGARDAAQGIDALEARLTDEGFSGATLGGARLKARADLVRIERDKGAVLGRAGGPGPLPPLPLAEGRETVWDGRLALTARRTGLVSRPRRQGSACSSQRRRRVFRSNKPALIAEARWLIAERVHHLLLPGERPKAPAFTGS